jgi:hypothetical protein
MKHEFEVGDVVTITKTKFTKKEWGSYYSVSIPFNIGDKLTIAKLMDDTKICTFVELYGYGYPVASFLPIENKKRKVNPIKSDKNLNYLIPIIKELNKGYG